MCGKEKDDLIVRCACMEHEVERYRFRCMHNKMAEMGLYRGDPRLLIEVLQNDGSTQAELARHLCIKAPSLTVMIKRMETAGMVCRRQDEKDMRVVRVYITEKGRETAAATKEAFLEMNRAVRKGVEEEQLRIYAAVLERMKENLQQEAKKTDRKGCGERV